MSELEGNDLLSRLTRIVDDLKAKSEAPTLVPSAIDYTEAVRARIERMTAFPVEQDVLQRIFDDNPQLDPKELWVMRRDYGMHGPTLLEYQHPPYPNTTYIFIHRDCQDPNYLGMGRAKEPIDFPFATFNQDEIAVLLKLGVSGKFTEIYRWKKETQS